MPHSCSDRFAGLVARLRMLWVRVACLAVVACAGVSCTDLSAVREFAETSADATQFSQIADDYASYFVRVQRYSDRKGASSAAQSKTRANQAKALKAFLKAASAYMKALGQLAEDKLASTSAGSKSVFDALVKAGAVNSERAAVGRSIVQLVSSAITEGWRRRKLIEFLEKGRSPFNGVMRAIKHFVQIAINSDKIEMLRVDRYYESILDKPGDPSAKAVLKEWHLNKKKQIENKTKAKKIYLKAIDKIISGHEDIYNNRFQLDVVSIKSFIESNKDQIKALFEAAKRIYGEK